LGDNSEDFRRCNEKLQGIRYRVRLDVVTPKLPIVELQFAHRAFPGDPDAEAADGVPVLVGFALGRKSWLFAGSDRGADRAAVMVTLITTAKMYGVDPQARTRTGTAGASGWRHRTAGAGSKSAIKARFVSRVKVSAGRTNRPGVPLLCRVALGARQPDSQHAVNTAVALFRGP
jgi:hypothetical protein